MMIHVNSVFLTFIIHRFIMFGMFKSYRYEESIPIPYDLIVKIIEKQKSDLESKRIQI